MSSAISSESLTPVSVGSDLSPNRAAMVWPTIAMLAALQPLGHVGAGEGCADDDSAGLVDHDSRGSRGVAAVERMR
jgi:hypothetical protein